MTASDVQNAVGTAIRPGGGRAESAVHALVIGAAGKFGEELLNQILASNRYQHVYVTTLSELGTTAPRVRAVIVKNPHDALSGLTISPGASYECYCCLDDSRTYYGRDDIYHRLESAHVVPMARQVLALGATRLALVKPLDSNTQMGGYGKYLTDKEELELVSLPFQIIVIVRPTQERQQPSKGSPIQRLANWILLTLGSYMTPAKLRPRRAKVVARTCIEALQTRGPGIHILAADELPVEGGSDWK